MRGTSWIFGLVVVGLAVWCGGGSNGNDIDSGPDTDTDTDADDDSDTDTDAATDTASTTETDTYADMQECAGGEGKYDPTSDLCWQDPPAYGELYWQSAIDHCDSLVLGGYDDWRLPSISELRSLIRGCAVTETGGDCGVTDDCLGLWDCIESDYCGGCSYLDGPTPEGCYWDHALQGDCRWFWSSSKNTSAPSSTLAWRVLYYKGTVSIYDTVPPDAGSHYARCVRNGP